MIGPLIALAAFTCLIGNAPLAAVLWNGGISFGGVVAFIFGDLIVPTILNIYRKYYGAKPTWFRFGTFYVVMVLAALCVEDIFSVLHWVPSQRGFAVAEVHITFNYTAVLNILFFAITAAILSTVFLRSGGPTMLRMMGSSGHGASDRHH